MTTVNEEPAVRRRWLLPTAIGAVTIVAIGVAIGVIASGGSEEPAQPIAASTEEPQPDTGPRDKSVSDEPVSAADAGPSAPLSEDEAAEAARAETTVTSLVAVINEISERGDGATAGIDAIATGWVLGELESHAREQFDLGYRQVGEAKITSIDATEVDLSASPATITLKVCLDVSGIDVLDASGNSLQGSLYNPGHPVAHLYGAIFEDDTWKISTHDIPDTQDCAAG